MGSRKGPSIASKQPSLFKSEEQEAPTPPGSGSAQKKRKCIPMACEQCRRRKSRCDGQKPECSACRFVYKTQCSFNEAESVVASPTKSQHEATSICSSPDHEVVKTLLEAPASRLHDLINRLRDLGDATMFLEEVRNTRALTPSSDSLEQSRFPQPKLGNLSGEPMIMGLRLMRDLGYQITSPSQAEPQQTRPATPMVAGWTTVTTDKQLVTHLIKLYFTWLDPFYTVLSKRHFERDLLAHPGPADSKYCSPLLVNAICAVGCTISDRPDVVDKTDETLQKGRSFMNEAKRLLDKSMASASLTTVQALGMMSIYEIASGNEQRGSLYMAMCMRMALDMNMNREDQGYKNVDPDEAEALQVTFWGCFNLDGAWAKFVARTPSISLNEIVLEQVANNPLKRIIPEDQIPVWQSYTDQSNPENATNVEQDISFFQQLTSLSKIINAMAHSYYASGQTVNSTKLLEYHGMYLNWFKQLPPQHQYRSDASPGLMCLHLYYSSCIIHLFMPLSRHKLVNSKVVPRNECAEHAYRITNIVRDYRRLWGIRHVFLPVSHILMAAMYIYIDNWPSETAREKLSQSLDDLLAMGVSNGWAKRCVTLIINWATEQRKDIFYVPPPPAPPRLKDSIAPLDPSIKAVAARASSGTPVRSHTGEEGLKTSSATPSSAGTAAAAPSSLAAGQPGTAVTSRQTTPSNPTASQQSFSGAPMSLDTQYPANPDQLYLSFPGRNLPLHNTVPSSQMPMDLPRIMNGTWGHLGYIPLEEWNENMVDTSLPENLGMATFSNTGETFSGQEVDNMHHSSDFQGYHGVTSRGVFQGDGSSSLPSHHHPSLSAYNMLGNYSGGVEPHHNLHDSSMYSFSHAGSGPAMTMPAHPPQQQQHDGQGRPFPNNTYPEWNTHQ